jgi:hypothetical protein
VLRLRQPVEVPKCNFPTSKNSSLVSLSKITCSLILNSLGVLPLSVQLFCMSYVIFKFHLISAICSSISLSNFGTSTTLFVGFSQLIGVLYFYHIKLQMDSSVMKLDIHYYRKIQLNASSLPTWMAYLSHTFLTYLQSLD